MSGCLDRLAESHGIQLAYISELGERQVISDEAKRALLTVLGVDPDEGKPGDFDEEKDMPTRRCALPGAIAGNRAWGVACQLYSLRSHRNLGIGDFEDLANLAQVAAAEGAAFIGVNPLHALFMADPGRYSPYSPSSRRFLNPFYIAIDQLAGGPEAIARLRNAESDLFAGLDGTLVDYPAAGEVKRALLKQIFADRIEIIRQDQGFERFCAGGDESLAGFALFEAISEKQAEAGAYAGWHSWPAALQDRDSPEVARFAEDNADLVLYHCWLQYEAEEQLAEAQARALAAGMPIGLYLDLAVGVAPDGAETWADPSLTVGAARVGSPPDMFNSQGQDWGLAPLSPKALAERGYQPLRDSFEALTRNAGAIRIDHVMGLARLWWIPDGVASSGGGYVRYPLGAMVDAVAAASEANACLVIGEDLGTVPPGFRHKMEAARILSYRVLYFERHRETEFLPPSAYPKLALACVSTHDLATLAGWWRGADIALRAEMGTQDAAATVRDRDSRQHDRRALAVALAEEGILPDDLRPAVAGTADLPVELPAELAVAIHRFIARTPSVLVTVQLDDMVGAERQPNLPGTTDQYPNWRIRSDVPIEDLPGNERFLALAAAMREERPVAS
ncbi:MAG TPA: 4-alpha-glucanotransferase [Aurantimonas sp.]